MRKILMRLVHPFWRMSRGITLGARACVVDPDGRILLVKHSYLPGWQFPGGGVEWAETAEAAVVREIREETGVEVTGPLQLHGIFSNHANFGGDHIVVFVSRDWRRPVVPGPNVEIIATAFFAPGELPSDTTPGTGRRVAEIFGAVPVEPLW